ncbi:MAG: hypothetical protein IKP58_18355 [Victivallales bacterium]|nr:hypothetical protein [Victivallales bacterium]
MNRRFRQYNLVEVILALGVVAIGVVSIMALFPIGTSATRDAAMETYSSNAADEMFHMLQFMAFNDEDTLDKAWKKWVIETNKLETSKPDYDAYNTDKDQWKRMGNTTKGIDGNIFETTTSKKGVFLLISHHDPKAKNTATLANAGEDEDGSDEDKISYEMVDFRAVVLAWKEKVREDPTDATKDIDFDDAAKLVIEVSWPEEMPYAARQKRYFSYEIAKPGAYVLE